MVVFAGSGVTLCPQCGYYALMWYDNPAPTCTANGVREYECGVCSYSKLESLPKLGHSYNIPKATCEVDKYCTRCYYVAEPAPGHLWAIRDDGRFECVRCNKIL